MKANYTWLADGTKLHVRSSSGHGFDYVGSLTYNPTGLESAQFSHGVIRAGQGGSSGSGGGSGNGSGQEINYHLTDHLGSVRAIVDANGNVRERNDYYAFGAKHTRPDYPQTINRFDFNGKEAQDDLGLAFLDYGARMYNPELGRWFNQDPLAEKYYPFSGYHFSGNNPLSFVDKDGRFYDGYQLDKNGYIKRISNEGGDKYDVLYSPDKRNNLKLDDTSILKNLSSVGRDNASFTWGSPSELASLFLFASDFSSVEWRFSRFDIGNGDQYALGTIHHPSLSIHTKQMGFSPFDEIALIHSHPTAWKSAMEEYKSMGWSPVPKAVADFMYGGQSWVNLSGDSQNVSEDHNRYKSYNNYYTYFPRNGNIYRVRGVEYPAYIKNISKHNNNPKSLFWGILNGK